MKISVTTTFVTCSIKLIKLRRRRKKTTTVLRQIANERSLQATHFSSINDRSCLNCGHCEFLGYSSSVNPC